MQKNKKILFILAGFGYGGTVFSTLNMLSYLKDYYDISVLPIRPYGPVKNFYKDYNVLSPSSALKAVSNSSTKYEYSFWEKTMMSILKIINHLCLFFKIDFIEFIYNLEAQRLMRSEKYDFVASTQERASTQFAKCFKGAKRIAWFRSEYSVYKNQLSKQQLDQEQILYRSFDQIVCVSKTTRDDFCKYFPDIQDRVLAIHNIQDVNSIIQKSKQPIQERFSKDCFNIVSVGRIAKQKQFYLIPYIASEVRKRDVKTIMWYIIGDGNVDGERERLNEALDTYGNRDYVIELGSRKNPYPYIASADLLVNTSYYEACPRVVAEAKILHTPVVCADFSSAREFVENGYDGFVGSINELPDIIANLISDSELYAKIKNNCDKYELDNNYILNQLLKIFE